MTKKFKKGDRVVVVHTNKYVTAGQTGEVTQAELVNRGPKEFWWYAVKMDNSAAPSYMFTEDGIRKV